MAKCPYCKREMLEADGCSYKHVTIYGKKYKRIKVGDPGDVYENGSAETRCGDCGAKYGHYHHPECDMETSPYDYGQLLYNCEHYRK